MIAISKKTIFQIVQNDIYDTFGKRIIGYITSPFNHGLTRNSPVTNERKLKRF